jgi:DNA invertase Pin-like site-specific DNA recombinase
MNRNLKRRTKKAKLTDRQIKAIPHIVACPTYTEGCKKAKINKTTLYKWLTEVEKRLAEQPRR